MLAIARVLRMGARLLLLDEPTEGLAPVIVAPDRRHHPRHHQAAGVAVLLIEQNVRFAATVADRHYLLAQGRVVERLDNDEFVEREDELLDTSASDRSDTSPTHDEERHDERATDRCRRLVLMAGVPGRRGCGGGGPSAAEASSPTTRSSSPLLNDQSGVYKDLSGPNSAGRDPDGRSTTTRPKYGDKAVAKTIEVTSADHQNKPDIANTKAQEMYDRQNADVILDVPTSSAALAVADPGQGKKKLYINIGAATTALTGAQCNKYTFHWAYDTCMLANGTGTVVTERRQELEHRSTPTTPSART